MLNLSGVDYIIVPKFIESPALSCNEDCIQGVFQSLIEIYSQFKVPQTTVLLNWVRSEEYNSFASLLESRYVGYEEALSDINCWPTNYKRKPVYLRFKKEEYWTEDPKSYLSEEDARQYIVTIKDQSFFDAQGQLIKSICGKMVLKKNGCLYLKKFNNLGEKSLRWSHSALTRGKRILSAGYFVIKNGKLICMTDGSGHYKTRPQHYGQVKDLLKAYDIEVPECEDQGVNGCAGYP